MTYPGQSPRGPIPPWPEEAAPYGPPDHDPPTIPGHRLPPGYGLGPAADPAAVRRRGHGPAGNQLYWLVGGVGALAVICFVLFLLVFIKSTAPRPDTTAAAYVVAANAKDVGAVNQLTCAAQQGNITVDPLSKLPQALTDQVKDLKAHATLKAVSRTTDTTAIATVEMTVTGLPGLSPTSNISSTVALNMTKDSDGWKICGVRGIR